MQFRLILSGLDGHVRCDVVLSCSKNSEACCQRQNVFCAMSGNEPFSGKVRGTKEHSIGNVVDADWKFGVAKIDRVWLSVFAVLGYNSSTVLDSLPNHRVIPAEPRLGQVTRERGRMVLAHAVR